MSFERIMGLELTNNEAYKKYRESMIAILHSFGGSFGVNFEISKVLKSKQLIIQTHYMF